jgi:predicted transcriptional regulator
MAETLFHCDDALWRRFTDLCRARDETPGAVLRDLVRLEVQRSARRKARSAEGIDERLLVRHRLLVAEALVEARDWPGLQAALRRRGLRYEPAGGGLNLIDIETGDVLAKASRVGPAYLDLVRRFHAGFPGHPNPGIAAGVLAGPDLTPPAPSSAAHGSAGGQAH